MNKYLIDLFKDENTVIIPGLGALTIVNRATNELMFMSYLKHNDGTLVKYIAERDGVDTDTAMGKVGRFVEEVKTALDNGGVFRLEQIGTFSKDAAGDIQYAPADEQNSGEVKAADAVTVVQEEIAEVKEETPEPEPVQEMIVEKEAIVEQREPEVEQVIQDSVVEEQPVNEEKVAEAVKTETEISEVAPASEEEQWNDDLDLPPLNYQPERPKKPILEKTKKDRKPRRTGTVWLLLFALIIVGASAYIGTNYNELKEKIPFLAAEKEVVEENSDAVETEPEQEVEVVAEEAMMPEEEVVEEPKEVEIPVEKTVEPKVKEQQTTVPVSGGLRVDKQLPVQIIVGSFGEEANARRMVEKLKAQGFPAEVIGVHNGLHTVSAASFSSMEEYRANQSRLQDVGTHWVKR